MGRVAAVLLGMLAALGLAMPAYGDIYREVAADGSITLTNVYRKERKSVRLRREAPAPPAMPVATAKRQRGEAGALPYAALVAAAAVEHGLPEALLHAVIRAESNYDPYAVSPKGAAGLMQLMPDTARELGVADVWDPAANIRGGARYLRRLLEMFDQDLSLAVAAYNAGPGAVIGSGSAIPPFAETQRYVPKVLEHYRRLQSGG
ncbi:lytic transglycosylase domain-containing protein [Azotobacter chroococcum]|uniref:Transglycosylase-like protein with SLT domain n=1 Tax=Azotobacter chroococcum TaxID=353 RepID=A0A4R1PL19_9GAMM|nr:lytic transglycosylase domain-containing protein [Azotobacter chroococcum]TBV99419.1 lytic transglycosylase domain-containing protein [Azotobacter chroococcum]TCL31188.1 transglycosylase-like protein with SLT domain [Azotobacter chroococcum]